ncbi:hypothetical protein ZIOFF_048464 [Zingiber officinale]|uniref:Uncharacterized protein n=1 Tax=Zingiber officinale TaxID=94328 RepID=A0A8J5FR86_ZINOF|nr:hypothetical protein ZIOFF_048464 [Zingiber officinale]
MLGTLPAFLSLLEMFLPDLSRGIAVIVSECFGSGLGNPSKYSRGDNGSPQSLSKQEPSTEPPWVPVRPEPPDWPGQIVPASVEKKQLQDIKLYTFYMELDLQKSYPTRGSDLLTWEFTNLKYSRVEIDEVQFEWAECMLDYI